MRLGRCGISKYPLLVSCSIVLCRAAFLDVLGFSTLFAFGGGSMVGWDLVEVCSCTVLRTAWSWVGVSVHRCSGLACC